MSGSLLSLFLLALTAQSALSALVGYVDDGNVRVVPAGPLRYILRLPNPYGSVLDEVVSNNGPGNYQVLGRLRQPNFISAGNFVYGRPRPFPRPPRPPPPHNTRIEINPDITFPILPGTPYIPQPPEGVERTAASLDSQELISGRAPQPEQEPDEDWMKMYDQ